MNGAEHPPAGTPLCPADAVPEGGAREVVVDFGDEPFSLVLFRRHGAVRAFRNRCPHFHLPLNVRPDRFIMVRDGLVMCAWHSAVFDVTDGRCVDGPCRGLDLSPIPLAEAGGMLAIGRDDLQAS